MAIYSKLDYIHIILIPIDLDLVTIFCFKNIEIGKYRPSIKCSPYAGSSKAYEMTKSVSLPPPSSLILHIGCAAGVG